MNAIALLVARSDQPAEAMRRGPHAIDEVLSRLFRHSAGADNRTSPEPHASQYTSTT